MARSMRGEFTPPRELVAIGFARVTGRGELHLSDAGLAIDAELQGTSSRIPAWSSLVVLGVGAAISALVPHAERILTPATVAIVAGFMWMRYRAEYGVASRFVVAWSGVEHVVRMQSAPDVVAFVLAGPIAGRGTPEQVYFAPADGVDALFAEVRAAAPAHLSLDPGDARPAEPAAAPPDDDLFGPFDGRAAD